MIGRDQPQKVATPRSIPPVCDVGCPLRFERMVDELDVATVAMLLWKTFV